MHNNIFLCFCICNLYYIVALTPFTHNIIWFTCKKNQVRYTHICTYIRFTAIISVRFILYIILYTIQLHLHKSVYYYINIFSVQCFAFFFAYRSLTAKEKLFQFHSKSDKNLLVHSNSIFFSFLFLLCIIYI